MLRKPFSTMFAAAMLASMTFAATANPALDLRPDELSSAFSAADANGDGQLTLAEAQAGAPVLGVLFRAIDTDGSGAVTAEELEAFKQALADARTAQETLVIQALFKSLDADGSGGLSAAEVQSAAPSIYRRFGAIDTNGDGQISLAELQAAMTAFGGPHGHR